jgi:hypothetical protein
MLPLTPTTTCTCSMTSSVTKINWRTSSMQLAATTHDSSKRSTRGFLFAQRAKRMHQFSLSYVTETLMLPCLTPWRESSRDVVSAEHASVETGAQLRREHGPGRQSTAACRDRQRCSARTHCCLQNHPPPRICQRSPGNRQ